MKVYYSFLSSFSEDDFEAFYKYFPKEKREALQRVKSDKAKKESVLVWYLLHKALSEKGVEDYGVLFGEEGKPYLKNLPLFFSLSHSNDFVCCALGEREVGVDAEKIKPVKDTLVNKVLTEAERLSLKDKDSDFIRFWTLKESFLKHRGSGITDELFSLDFSPFADKESFQYDSLFFTVKKTDGYYISVCSEEKETGFIKV